MTEENMTGRGAKEEGKTGDFALQIPQGVLDLLQNTTEPGAVATDFGDDDNRFELNTRKIAKELIGYTSITNKPVFYK